MLNLDTICRQAEHDIFRLGRIKGKADALQEMRLQLLTYLNTRFPNSPDNLEYSLAQVSSLAELMNLTYVSYSCESVEAFLNHCPPS